MSKSKPIDAAALIKPHVPSQAEDGSNMSHDSGSMRIAADILIAMMDSPAFELVGPAEDDEDKIIGTFETILESISTAASSGKERIAVDVVLACLRSKATTSSLGDVVGVCKFYNRVLSVLTSRTGGVKSGPYTC